MRLPEMFSFLPRSRHSSIAVGPKHQEGAIAAGGNYSSWLPAHTWCLTGSWLAVKQPHSHSRMNWFVRDEIAISGLIDKVFY